MDPVRSHAWFDAQRGVQWKEKGVVGLDALFMLTEA